MNTESSELFKDTDLHINIILKLHILSYIEWNLYFCVEYFIMNLYKSSEF